MPPDQFQNVRSFQPPQIERFDQQFWPIFMALCVTATVTAATIVSLLDGVWMWVSLMVLPAAFAIVIFALRFMDDRRWQRSVQLAVILSLALHCCFIIFAHQTNVFEGFFLNVNRISSSVNQPRVLHISRNVEEQPWMEINEVPTPVPEEQPVIEKQAEVDTATVRPQPTPVESQQTSENPQLVRRQQVSRTVPRLGENVSRLSRQTENVTPRSGQQVSPSKPLPNVNTTARATSPSSSPSQTEITRNEPSSNPTEIRRNTSRAEQTPRPTASTAARTVRTERPSSAAPRTTRSTRRAQANPSLDTPRPTTRSTSVATRTNPSRRLSSSAANVERRSTQSTQRQQNVRPQAVTLTSPTAQLAQRRPRDQKTMPSIASQNRLAQSQRSQNTALRPTSSQPIERPRPNTRTAENRGIANLQPQPMAIQRSSGGTAGVGRTANLNRDLGSRQSSAVTAADSVRRSESTTQRVDPNSMTLRQASRVPRTSAGEIVPSSTLQADSIPLASRAATERQNQNTANASAALSESNSDARRSNVSAQKGTGNVDLGSTKIVNETLNRRVEGGGQPEIQNQPSQQRVVRAEEQGSSTPSIAAPTPDRIAAVTQQDNGANQLADESSAMADSDVIARARADSAISGGPTESTVDASDPSTSTAFESAASPIGRSNDDDDEDEELAGQGSRIAESARRSTDSSSPNVAMEVSMPERASSRSSGNRSEIAERTVEVISRASGSLPGSGIARATSRALAAAASSMPVIESSRRGSASRQAPTDVAKPTTGIARSTDDASPALSMEATPGQPSSRVASRGISMQTEDALRATDVAQSSSAGIALDIEAEMGPAGVGRDLQPDPGIDSRRASRDSPAIQSMTETRFRRERAGGTPSVNTAPVIAKEAFRSRNNPSRRRSAPRTEEAIELGLAWLARHQQDDGSWSLTGFDDDRNDRAKQLSSDSAATALALLAFQGAGYNHKEFKYARQLELAVTWLVDNQAASGDLYVPMDEESNGACRLYSHGIATLALAEAFGMTQDQSLRQPVQRALDFIYASQHERLGGWRYRPGKSSDTSVTGWMMMALQSGKLTGLDTDESTWDGINRWLDGARSPEQAHLFRYNPLAEDTKQWRRSQGRVPTPCMTSVGLLMRLYTGWDRNDKRLQDGAAYLLQHLPSDESINTRDTYYWYYATQVLRHVGGRAWETWHGRLHPLLVRTQVKSGDMTGSWDPLNPVPDRWGAQAGRLYVTTMNLLSLEVDYRLLPLYDDTVK